MSLLLAKSGHSPLTNLIANRHTALPSGGNHPPHQKQAKEKASRRDRTKLLASRRFTWPSNPRTDRLRIEKSLKNCLLKFKGGSQIKNSVFFLVEIA
jgi:hypothetical protein